MMAKKKRAAKTLTLLLGREAAEYLTLYYRYHFRYKFLPPPRSIWDAPILIHIPKTAGSSLIAAGATTIPGHKPFTYFERWCPNDITLPVTYAVVRNPYDRFLSAFDYLRCGGGNAYDRRWAKRWIRGIGDPNEFVHYRLRHAKVRNWLHFLPQTYFIMNRQGVIGVDCVLYYENLHEVWASVAQRFSLAPQLPVKKGSSRQNSFKQLNADSMNILAEIYQPDFDRLQYPVECCLDVRPDSAYLIGSDLKT